MKLISSPLRQELERSCKTTYPYSLEIIQRYGPFEKFCIKFSPANSQYCVENFRRSHGTPTLIMCIRTYGNECIESLLQSHLVSALLSLGVEHRISDEDIRLTVRNICNSEKGRLLSMVSIIIFFHQLGCGSFQLYEKEISPRRILEAFNFHYFPKAKRNEENLRNEVERISYKNDYDSHKKECITYDEYKNLAKNTLN